MKKEIPIQTSVKAKNFSLDLGKLVFLIAIQT